MKVKLESTSTVLQWVTTYNMEVINFYVENIPSAVTQWINSYNVEAHQMKVGDHLLHEKLVTTYYMRVSSSERINLMFQWVTTENLIDIASSETDGGH